MLTMMPSLRSSLFDDMALSMLTRCPSFEPARPHLDERDDSYTITVAAPGVRPQDLDISIADGLLAVRSRTMNNMCNFTVSLPRDADVDAEEVAASAQDGIVIITLPKKAAEEHTQIAIQTDEAIETADCSTSSYTLKLAVPGLAAADLSVVHNGELLHVSGETAKTGAQVDRIYRLPRDADARNARASHVDGLLTIIAPKSTVAAVRRLTVTIPVAEAVAAEVAADGDQGRDQGAKMDMDMEVPPEEVVSEEWKDSLDDLAEMGFDDRDANRAALSKHAGSIKLAVKELVTSRRRRM